MKNIGLIYQKKSFFFTGAILSALLLMSPVHVKADGEQLMKNCETALAYLEGSNLSQFASARAEEYMTCPGYIEGVIDLNYQYQAMLGKDSIFCLPEKKLDKVVGMKVVIEYMREHSELLKEDEGYLVSAAFSTKYPCISLMKKGNK